MKSSLELVNGTLHRSGVETPCKVVVRKHSSKAGITYTDCLVLKAPDSLGDGEYILTFDRHTALVEKASGLWLSCDQIRLAIKSS